MQQSDEQKSDRDIIPQTTISECDSSNPAPISDPEVINLLDYVEVVAKRWRMIITVMSIAFVLSIAVSLTKENIYSSTALILPPQKDNMLGMMGLMAGGTGGGAMSGLGDLLGKGTASDLYVGMLNSRAIQDRIIDRFKLDDLYKMKYRMDTYKVLESHVEISAGKKDGIISISMEDKDPKRAADIANAYVEELSRLLVKLNITGSGQSREFLEERLAKVKGELTRAEEALKNFQTKNKTLDVPDQAALTIKGVAELKAQLAVQEVQLSALRGRLTDNAQEVKDQKATIGNLRSQIAQLEGRGGSSSSIPSIGSVPALGQQYLRLMREFKVQEASFELLTKLNEMTKLSQEKDEACLQIIQKATMPDKKVKPKRTLMVLVSTFVAALGSTIYAFIAEAYEKMPSQAREQWARIMAMLPNVFAFFATIRRRLGWR